MGKYFRILQDVLLVIDSLSASPLKDVIFDARLRLPATPIFHTLFDASAHGLLQSDAPTNV